jgi:hypothetical protein
MTLILPVSSLTKTQSLLFSILSYSNIVNSHLLSTYYMYIQVYKCAYIHMCIHIYMTEDRKDKNKTQAIPSRGNY